MRDLARELAPWRPRRRPSPWRGHEHNAGWGVMLLPTASDHLLGLRVFPEGDLGGYVSVWHRDPAERWEQFVDHAPVEHGCPRVWGPALHRAAPARIEVDWPGPTSVRVRMDEPALDWRMEIGTSPVLTILNALHARLPLATWRARWMVRARELVARALGLGPVAMAGTAPTGATLTAVMRRIHWVVDSRARLDGRDLGGLVTLPSCPTIGGWPLPRRAVLVVGEAHTSVVEPSRIQVPT